MAETQIPPETPDLDSTIAGMQQLCEAWQTIPLERREAALHWFVAWVGGVGQVHIRAVNPLGFYAAFAVRPPQPNTEDSTDA